MVLMRFDPFRDLDRLGQDMWSANRRQTAMPIDAYRKGDAFQVHFDLPGVDPSAVELTVEKNVLTVRCDRAWRWGDDVELLVAERPQGTFTRQLFLGENLQTDNIQASYDDGVLTVTIPVAEEAKPRKVEIGTNGRKSTAISAGSTESSGASPGQ